MEMLDKVERLREKADVSYEEARAALEQTGGDLLDAMVLLEREGKVKGPGRTTYSTNYDEQKDYLRVKDKVEEQKRSSGNFGHAFGKLLRGFFRFLRTTVFNVTRREDTIFTMPTWVFALLLFLFWEVLAPVMVIALFFEVRYSYSMLFLLLTIGPAFLFACCNILEKAGTFAEDVRSEFRKESAEDSNGSTDSSGGR